MNARRWIVSVSAAAIAASSGCRGGDNVGRRAQREPTSVLDVFAPPTPGEAARDAVNPFDASARARGLLLLANAPWGGERVYQDLYNVSMQDGDPLVRAMAVRAIAMHGRAEQAPMIAEQLKNADRFLRWESARALQRMHNPEVVPALLRSADPKNESDAEIRAATVRALGQYPEPRVLTALIARLEDRDLAVNREARWSLRTLTGEDYGDDLPRWVRWQRETQEPFARRGQYTYPIFERDRYWWEWIQPFWQPPNEKPGAVIGAPAVASTAAPSPAPAAPAPAPAR
ncbi:MAG: HEAT repeat domain-containing protein [Phycisphaerales bacterium]|nr:HEAT repeat domain-containing protein [Phycisphaerales bacterium]